MDVFLSTCFLTFFYAPFGLHTIQLPGIIPNYERVTSKSTMIAANEKEVI